MSQKLRTARSGMVFLFAVLCIVCLSLSLVLSANFAAYAEGEDSSLPDTDTKGNDLWLVHYTDAADQSEKTVQLLDGAGIGKYLGADNDGNPAIVTSDDAAKRFTQFRGETVTLTLKLNPAYEVEAGKTLDSLYNLDAADYGNNSLVGSKTTSVNVTTTVTVPSKDGSVDGLSLTKDWTIATYCNTVDVTGTYIKDRGYAEAANYDLLRPALGNTVVYDLQSANGDRKIIAVQYSETDTSIKYLCAGHESDGYYLYVDENGDTVAWDATEVQAAADSGNLINYLIRKLNHTVSSDSDENPGAYMLTVTAMDLVKDGYYYVQTNLDAQGKPSNYSFDVVAQSLGNDSPGDRTFEDNFRYDIRNSDVVYTGDTSWIDSIGFSLYLKDGYQLVRGVDYDISVASDSVGKVDLVIMGIGNLIDAHTIVGRINVNPVENTWEELPNIITWAYGTYKAENNKIVARPKFGADEHPEDIKFRIVARVLEGDKIVDKEIAALSDIHYVVNNDSADAKWSFDSNVTAALSGLTAGNYRLYASVYGSNITDSEKDRNYRPIEESSVDFTVFVGTNMWEAGSEPTIKTWTAGKLDTTDGLINAASVFDKNPILMIYKIGEKGENDQLIYSNLPSHANTEYGDIEVLKGLKAGRYYLSAEVKETANYTGLKTTVLFDVVPNNLPVWAVILIVVGSLGTVAVVFVILHEKGILQMLTGKVLLSMRTRANVDATLAAIRAAKVAREAEASVAAAKAREAEEAAKAEKDEKSKK